MSNSSWFGGDSHIETMLSNSALSPNIPFQRIQSHFKECLRSCSYVICRCTVKKLDFSCSPSYHSCCEVFVLTKATCWSISSNPYHHSSQHIFIASLSMPLQFFTPLYLRFPPPSELVQLTQTSVPHPLPEHGTFAKAQNRVRQLGYNNKAAEKMIQRMKSIENKGQKSVQSFT